MNVSALLESIDTLRPMDSIAIVPTPCSSHEEPAEYRSPDTVVCKFVLNRMQQRLIKRIAKMAKKEIGNARKMLLIADTYGAIAIKWATPKILVDYRNQYVNLDIAETICPIDLWNALAKIKPGKEVEIVRETDGRLFVIDHVGVPCLIETSDSFDMPSHLVAEPMLARFSLASSLLAQSLDRVTFAVADENSRCALANVSLEWDLMGIKAVATDSRRLAVTPLETNDLQGVDLAGRVLLPSPAVELWRELIDDRDEDYSWRVRLSKDGAVVHASPGSESIRLEMSSGDGIFPKWQDILPSKWEPAMQVCVERGSLKLLRSISKEVQDGKTASSVEFTFTPNDTRGIKVTLPTGRHLYLPASQRLMGCDPVTVLLKPSMMLEWIDAIGDRSFILSVISPNRPVVMQDAVFAPYSQLLVMSYLRD